MQKQLSAIEGHIERAKFVPDLKRIAQGLVDALSDLSIRVQLVETELREAYKAMQRCESVLLEHAKLLDPAAFNEEADAPADQRTTEDTEDTEATTKTGVAVGEISAATDTEPGKGEVKLEA